MTEPRTKAGAKLLDDLALSASANAYGRDAQGEGIEWARRDVARALPAIEDEAAAMALVIADAQAEQFGGPDGGS